MFNIHAEKYQPHAWFFAMTHDMIKNDLKVPNTTSLFVYKEDEAFFFDGMNIIRLAKYQIHYMSDMQHNRNAK